MKSFACGTGKVTLRYMNVYQAIRHYAENKPAHLPLLAIKIGMYAIAFRLYAHLWCAGLLLLENLLRLLLRPVMAKKQSVSRRYSIWKKYYTDSKDVNEETKVKVSNYIDMLLEEFFAR